MCANEDDEGAENDDDAEEDATACCLEGDLLRGEGFVWNYVCVGEVGKTHGFIASVNGGEGRVRAGLRNRSR